MPQLLSNLEEIYIYILYIEMYTQKHYEHSDLNREIEV